MIIMKRHKTLGDLFDFTIENITEHFNVGYSEELLTLLNEITDNDIDSLFIQYVGKSRNKCLSSTVNFCSLNYGYGENGEFSNELYLTLSKLTNNRYYKKWKKIFDTFSLEYNPIKPYDMTIHDHNYDEHGGETVIDRTHSDESEITNETEYDTTENGYQGFNSENYNPVDKSSNTSKDTSSSKVDVEGQVKTTHGRTVDSDRDITRSGNIGNITQQELIERERELWKYQIYDIIFRDLDSVYTRPKYYEGGC